LGFSMAEQGESNQFNPQARYQDEDDYMGVDAVELEPSDAGDTSRHGGSSPDLKRDGNTATRKPRSEEDINLPIQSKKPVIKTNDQQQTDGITYPVASLSQYNRARGTPTEGANIRTPTTQDGGLLTKQLSEKIRSQAARLSQLEAYADLLERRILEFDPHHPLPVTESMMGKGLPSNDHQNRLNDLRDSMSRNEREEFMRKVEELEDLIVQKDRQLHQQVKKGEKLQIELDHFVSSSTYGASPKFTDTVAHQRQFSGSNIQTTGDEQVRDHYATLNSKYQDLLNDKADLEESLRNETLLNEEQRAYIEVLKQALEARIEDLGLTNVLNTAVAKDQSGLDSIDFFTEMTGMKYQNDKLKRENSHLGEVLNEAERTKENLSRIVEELKVENQKLHEDRHQVAADLDTGLGAIDFAKAQVEKVEDEKSSLIDFIEERTKKLDEATHEITELNALVKSLEEERKEAHNQLTKFREENQGLQQGYESLQEHNQNLTIAVKELEQVLDQTRMELKDYQTKYV